MKTRRQFFSPAAAAASWLTAVLVGSALAGQEPPAASPFPDFTFDEADRQVEAELLEGPEWYDAGLVSAGDVLWYTWLEFTPGKGDRIWVGSRRDREWLTRRRITEQFGQYARPTLTIDSRGQLWLSFESLQGEQWDVFVMPLREGGPQAAPRRVSSGTGADIYHSVAPDAEGGLWFVWQSDRGGQFDVLARRLAREQAGEVVAVGDHPRGDWHPHVAVDRENTTYVVWDAFDGDQFNVYVRRCRQGRWEDKRAVASSAAFEGRAQVVTDAAGRAWIAWEEGGENWGKPFRGINTERLRDHHGPLHRFRLLRLAVMEPGGALSWLDDPLPMPSVDAARARPGRAPGLERSGAFYERPRMAIDAQGRLWIFYRHYYTPWLGIAHRSHVQEGWGVYARSYGRDGWSPLVRMSVGQGDGMQRLEVVPHGDSVAAVWTTGRTHRTEDPRPRGLVAAAVAGVGEPYERLALVPPPAPASASAPADAAPRPSATLGGKAYQVYFGDLHRHTDLSLCRVPIDGTIDDAYRYAAEVARLDFLGITDHSRDIAQGNALSQLWWRSRKEVLRYELRGAFVPFYAYERSHSETADHNVISLRPDMLRPHTYALTQFWRELDLNTITIPHQPIRRETWIYQHEELRPLVEIFQGCRDAAIEEDVHRGLAAGYHLGFIASSDHMSTSASYAGVWAEDASREAIFTALQRRRTFAATAKISMRVHAGEHWMGEIIRAERTPRISVEVRGTAPIRRIDTVIDGRVHATMSPDGPEVKLEPQLDLPGVHYVYFRVEQTDGNQAWSSPLWFEIGREQGGRD